MAPQYKKAASALKGVVKVGAVDCDEHKDLAGKFGVRGFPTIKVFSGKGEPTEFNGDRSAKGIAEAGLAEAKKKVKQQLDGGSSGGSGSKSSGGSDAVVELTDANFEKLVLNSEDIWLVEFFAPWCGHCKSKIINQIVLSNCTNFSISKGKTLAPQWSKAAGELKGKIKMGALDATVHTSTASKYQIQGYPTIKYFAAGKKGDAENYEGGRTSSDIVAWALERYTVNIPAPEVYELTSEKAARNACEDKPLCVVSFLPHILDCQSKCRNNYIKVLRELADKFKQKQWGWLWAEAGSQFAVEEALDVGGFGYPALSAVNIKKMKFSLLRGSYSKEGINEFLRDLSYGKGQILPIKGAELPKINELSGWDGKDGQPIEEEDIDLSDVDMDEKDEL